MDSSGRRHNRHSIRLRDYDYTQAGAYFVTICSWSRECLFGDVIDGKIQFNEYGQIVQECWDAIPEHFIGIKLENHIVMPNHVHLIILIVENGRGMACHAPTDRQFGKPISNSLSTIIGSFKSAVTKRINQIRNTPNVPVWQRNYYEHIIRNEDELNRIQEYIINNPLQWADDENNPMNINRSLLLET